MKCCRTVGWMLVGAVALASAIPSARQAILARLAPAATSAPRQLGDALTDAQHAARERVNAEAGGYRIPNVPVTRSQAIMAYVLLMRSAAQEDPRNAGYYKNRANEAAYKFRSADARNIVKTAADLARGGAPRTAGVALDIFNRIPASSASAPAAAPARRARTPRRRRHAGASAPDDTLVSTEPSDATMLSTPAGPPAWVPWAAGAGVLLALLAGATALARARA